MTGMGIKRKGRAGERKGKGAGKGKGILADELKYPTFEPWRRQ